MAGWLILAVGVAYCAVAIDLFFRGQLGHALTFAGYAFSNVGLYLATQ
jgi:hypothetical protein